MTGTVGPWELLRILGRGGMGEVWLARDPRDGREVALKLLQPGGRLQEDSLARFQREARILAELDHPAIVRTAGADLAAPRPWLALELLPGGSLAQQVRTGGPLSSRRVAELGLTLAGALERAHQAGVIHRDVKPENVLLDRSGAPRLTDFGLVRLFGQPGGSLTATGMIVGTPAYLSPEQARGEKERLGPATDVYGLGATLYFLLTGVPPHSCGTLLATLQAILLAPPTPPSQRRSGIDPGLEAIVLRCLAKAPADRWPTAGALALALRGWLHASAAAPRPPRLLLAGLGVAFGAALALTAAWALVSRPAVESVAPVAAPSSHAPAPPPAAELTRQGIAHARRGEDREALALFDRALELDPGSCQARVERLFLHVFMGRPDRALEDARELESRAPDSLARGLALGIRREPAAALRELDAAVAERPGETGPLHARALMRFQVGELEPALADLDRALELDPGDTNLLSTRAEARERLGQTPAALADLDRALELGPANVRARLLRAVIRRDARDLSGALLDFDALIEQGAKPAEAHANRGAIRSDLGDHAGARADFEESLRLAPDGPASAAARDWLARQPPPR